MSAASIVPGSAELRAALSPALAARVRVLDQRDPAPTGPLLAVLHHALRDHDHPLLALATQLAQALGRSLLIYVGLGGAHRYSSARHLRFAAEGIRALQAALTSRGFQVMVHLPVKLAAPTPLAKLASRSALVLAEDWPAPPIRHWTEKLATAGAAPWWLVDCSCLVPMAASDKAPERAFSFRGAHQKRWLSALGDEFSIGDAPRRRESDVLPEFVATDLAQIDLRRWLASLDCDQTVAPVGHTRGGSQAGYARWQAFVDSGGLRRYAELRNDAAVAPPLGVSRLSPYLHYGMVSPWRIAREARAVGGSGAEKFLDELYVWRELAHHWCAHQDDPERIAALPAWAQATLAEHWADPRPEHYSLSTLARGATADPLWNMAQAQLRQHGELHNNLRMSWAKALLAWSRDPAQALRRLVTLNHRYALDGSDANSYGGLLWALGLFDRPFAPAQPIYGTVRRRSLAAHRARLDMVAYANRVRAPASAARPAVIIGGGVAGLACARVLADHGHEVEVFDKGRALGGRLATRRSAYGPIQHGAPGFNASDWRFRALCAELADDEGLLAAAADGVYSARGGTRAFAAWLGQGLTIHEQRRVSAIRRGAGGWTLDFEDGSERSWPATYTLVLAIPAEQAVPLLAPVHSGFAERAAQFRAAPCWVLWYALAADTRRPIAIQDATIEYWPATAPAVTRLIVRLSACASQAQLEADPESLAADYAARLGLDQALLLESGAHRWRYAQYPPMPQDPGYWLDEQLKLAVTGDWLAGSGVEGAYLNGSALAGALLGEALGP